MQEHNREGREGRKGAITKSAAIIFRIRRSPVIAT
jgi:hypothetical protein